MKRAQKLAPLLAAALVLVGLLALRGADPAFLQAQRAAGFDTLQRLWPRAKPTEQNVRIVDIDEASLQKLGQWPWSRARLADINLALAELGAAAVAYDIVFPEEDRLSPRKLAQDPAIAALIGSTNPETLPDTDAAFAASLTQVPTVLGYAMGQQRDASTLPLKAGFAQTGQPATNAALRISKITGNIAPLETVAAGIGNFNIDLAGEQGVVRQLPLLRSDGERLLPALSIEALRVAQGESTIVVHGDAEEADTLIAIGVGSVEIPLSERGMLALHFRPDDPSLYVSAADLLDPEKRPALADKIEAHIVLVGTSAVGLLDNRTTPLGQTVPGVSVHAQALEQILAGRFLSRPDTLVGGEILAGLALALATAVLATWARPGFAFAFALVAAGGIAGFAALAFNRLGLMADATFPFLLLLGGFIASAAWRLLVTDRQGRLMRGAFNRYVSPAVLNEIERNPEALKLGGEVREASVLFLDIANFTPLSEKLKPEELVSVVNGLWDRCTRCILAEQGTIDKFIGDAVMAFWNAPLPSDAHQARACRAALAIRDAVHAYNHEADVRAKLEAVDAWPLGIRVGIATGDVCVGNMGSSDRFDYSVIGETVNTAARAEAACKHVQHDIVVAGALSPETQNLAILPAGRLGLKGRSTRQQVTAIIGDETMAASEEFKLLRKDLSVLAQATSSVDARAQIVSELALHHPSAQRFLENLSKRLDDYAT